MTYDYNDIEQKAQDLLNDFHVSELPISLELIAKKMGVNLLPFDLGMDVSGLLHLEENSATIGYNPNESKVRQRFTIAHEIGHYVLHTNNGIKLSNDDIFIDNKNHYQEIMFRSETTKLTSENYNKEKEANAFAAALLMPLEVVKKEILKYKGFDLSDNTMIVDLAKKFEVSIPAMSFRIINLSDSKLL